uniref:Ankyrin repeat protein n=1 Tax=Trichogramma kaykai TaxID=54128 RepID=A0ABD2XN50_9HYME
MSSDDESDSSYEVSSDEYDEVDPEKLERITSLRDEIRDWENEGERDTFLQRLYPVIRDWEGQYPNVLDIFRKEQIDRLLFDCVVHKPKYSGNSFGRYEPLTEFIEFVARSGYKDEPDSDIDVQPSLRRTTPVHHAAKRRMTDWDLALRDLFDIYDRYDANYADEAGFTHFHAACLAERDDVVEKFLVVGRLDPDCPVPGTGDAPLHLALRHQRDKTAELLLRSGADPNLANGRGFTPLHVIGQNCRYPWRVEMFFRINEERNQPVKIDARDKLGRTPLQLAVTNFLLHVVDALLDRGADASAIVFPPYDIWFDELLELWYNDEWTIASQALGVVESLEKKGGYKLDRRDAWTIMRFFAKHRLFRKPTDLDERWYDDEQFRKWAKEWNQKIGPSQLPLGELVRLRPAEAARRFSSADYYKLIVPKWFLSERLHKLCTAHLCELMSRGFFRRWALDALLKLTAGYHLPILCYEMIIEQLLNEDLCNVCFATTERETVMSIM